MSRTPTTHPEPGPECYCGGELKAVPLPADLAALSGRSSIWVHAESGTTLCYPDSANPKDAEATGEPVR